jgi:hypothetical protein
MFARGHRTVYPNDDLTQTILRFVAQECVLAFPKVLSDLKLAGFDILGPQPCSPEMITGGRPSRPKPPLL